ncbi:Uncharacterized protein APZ42_005665, partial [Daphnia magna]
IEWRSIRGFGPVSIDRFLNKQVCKINTFYCYGATLSRISQGN